ncbi:LacI family DNA-binding transcriptional regulator [Plantactinospora siamensis]|uniref:LacI family DNA-binding transcriptional regulator n=1 Tax=Plantactinospora siamensis TaxID=555372 RepID=A0ABV6P5H0_9ACTN
MATIANDNGSSGKPARVTIRQVANHAGVSEAAASYALNDRPGVSSETRARVQAAARDLGWAPNIAARALVASRAHAVGLVVVRPPRVMTVDSYFTQLLSGLEAELNRNGIALVLHLVDAIDDTLAVYRKWWAGRHVDGVIVTDLRREDPRLDVLRELGMPAAVIGGDVGLAGFSTVEADMAGITTSIIDYLRALGHRVIARVAGNENLFHTWRRDQCFLEAVDRAGLDRSEYQVLYTNYSAAEGMRAMRRLMSASRRPTAVVFDNDVMAAAALRVAHEMGLSVPADVSVVAWDDSDLCEITVPSITAVEQTPARQAELAARAVLAMQLRGDVSHVTLPAGTLNARQSTRPLRPRRS